MKVTPKVFQPTIILCLENIDKTHGMQSELKREGFQLIPVSAFFEVLKYVEQELPYLIVSDTGFADGNVCDIFDRLAQHAEYKKIPIVAILNRKNPEMVKALTQRQFAAFVKEPTAKNIINTIKQVLWRKPYASPFYLEAARIGLKPDVKLTANAVALGKADNFVIFKGDLVIDEDAVVKCTQKNSAGEPLELFLAGNIVQEGVVYNIFPLNQIIGQRRFIFERLPALGIVPFLGDTKLLICHENPKEANDLKSILAGYNLAADTETDPDHLKRMLENSSQKYFAVYILLNDPSLHERLQETISSLPQRFKPVLIFAVKGENKKRTEHAHFLRYPVGFGKLLQVVRAARFNAINFTRTLTENEAANLEVSFQFSARLLTLDETGGVFELDSPLVAGSLLEVFHPSLSCLWGEGIKIKVAACELAASGFWQARFVSMVQENKAKYWERVVQTISKKDSMSA